MARLNFLDFSDLIKELEDKKVEFKRLPQDKKRQYLIERKKLKLENLSDDFKNLYVKMVAFEPGERPTFDEILNSAWLKEVDIGKKIKDEGLITRSGGDDGNDIFKDHSLKPKNS